MQQIINCNDVNDNLLSRYLTNTLDISLQSQIRTHLDSCSECWEKWQNLRWQVASKTDGFAELKLYLGNQFRQTVDVSWGLAEEWNSSARTTQDNIECFYKTTDLYIYNLMLWQESGQRPDYVQQVQKIINDFNIKTILDFGCGIGTDGLALASQNYEVLFYDINHKCIEYVRWRLKQRNLNCGVYSEIPPDLTDLDILWIMDVVEHLYDPIKTLSPLLDKCRYAIFGSESTDKAGGRHPFHFETSFDKLRNYLSSNQFRLIYGNHGTNFEIWLNIDREQDT